MNKNIYDILNNTHNSDVEYEHLSDTEVNDIMKKFNTDNKTKTINKRIKKFAAGSVAVAACLTAFLIPVMSDSNDITNNSSTSIADNAAVQKNSFFLSVDAAEIQPDKAFGISMADSGGGEFPFSGRTFFINGTNIKNVSLSIDKGKLYKSSYEASYPAEKDLKPDKSYAECCECIGNEYTGAFDENISYGFYLSEEIFESEYSEDNFKKSWYACYDEFNDAILNISVEYEDGQIENTGYALKSGMLEINKETMKPNGNFSDGSTPYIYGIYFEPINN